MIKSNAKNAKILAASGMAGNVWKALSAGITGQRRIAELPVDVCGAPTRGALKRNAGFMNQKKSVNCRLTATGMKMSGGAVVKKQEAAGITTETRRLVKLLGAFGLKKKRCAILWSAISLKEQM